MELNLIYNDINRGFDTPLDIDIGYIKDLCIKIFDLKTKTFELFYNNENLNKFADNTELQEIIDNEEHKISIYVKLISNSKQNLSKNTNKINLKNQNLNNIKIKFDNFNSNYLKLNTNIKEFKSKYQEKIDIIKKLINDFEIDINIINNKIESYFNINEYNKCIETFNEDPEKISENELNILSKNIENCVKDFKIIETQNQYQTKIMDYLNDFIKKFQQIKKCCDNIKEINNFEKTITQLDLIYEILFNIKLSILRTISSFNGKKTINLTLKDEFTSTKELPYIENKNIKKNNFIQNESNIFQKYQNNVNLFKRRISQTIDLNDNKQENNNSFSPKKNKSNLMFNDKDNKEPFPQLENKSRNKIRKLTTRLKIQLSKTDNDSLPNLQKKKIHKVNNKETDKIIDDKNNEKEDKKIINLDLSKDRQSLTLKNNKNIKKNNGDENNHISLLESLQKKKFSKKKSLFSDDNDKLILLEQINKKMSLKNFNKTKYSISLDKKSNEKKSENENEMKNKENILLKNDIELLKNEIEKLKNYNNILKNDIEILKNNKNENNEKEREKERENTIFEKKIYIPVKKVSNLKSDSTSNFASRKITFHVNSSRNNTDRKERINSDNKILNESKDSKMNKKKEKEKPPITDLSSKLLELNESYDDNKDEEEKTPVEKKKINYIRTQNYILDEKNNKNNSLYNDNSNGNIIKKDGKRLSINYTLNEKKVENTNINGNNNNELNNENLDNDLNSQKDDKKRRRKLNRYDFII